MNTSRYVFSSFLRTSSLSAGARAHCHPLSVGPGMVHTVRGSAPIMRPFSVYSGPMRQEQQRNEQEEKEVNENEEQKDESNEEQKDEKDVKIEELENRVKELEKKYLMSLAETENTRRIAKVDIEKAKKYSLGNYTKSLLEVADNLERAMTVINPDQLDTEFQEEKPKKKVRTLLQGIKMTHNILQRVFKNHGIEKIPNPLGEKFDPKFHDAISQQPDPNQKTGTVSYVISEGYMINDRVLRATSVAVVVNEDEDLPSFDESECLTTEKPGEESGETEKMNQEEEVVVEESSGEEQQKKE